MFAIIAKVSVITGAWAGQSGIVNARLGKGPDGIDRYEVKLDNGVIMVYRGTQLEHEPLTADIPTVDDTPAQGQGKADPSAAWELACDALVNAAVDKDLISRERMGYQDTIRQAEEDIKAAKAAIKQLDYFVPRLHREARKLVKLNISHQAKIVEMKERASAYRKR